MSDFKLIIMACVKGMAIGAAIVVVIGVAFAIWLWWFERRLQKRKDREKGEE